MEKIHSEIYFAPETQAESNDPEEPNKKSGSGQIKIFNVRSKKERNDMLQMTIPDMKAAREPWPMESIKAQNVHRSIFEMMVIDLVPFTEVNKPGFLRHHHRLVPNFQVTHSKSF